VDVFHHSRASGSQFWRGSTSVADLFTLLGRFLGPERARDALADYARQHGARPPDSLEAGPDLVHHVETLLAGTIGSASARAMLASVAQEEPLGIDEVMTIIDEASQVLAYSRQLEQKSRELETASSELRGANARLQELDRLKDDFIFTVTHELRTPLTSIRAFSEILRDHPDMETAQRTEFVEIVIRESERLTRLINQVLDLAKLESGNARWNAAELDLRAVIGEAVATTSQLFRESSITLCWQPPSQPAAVCADHDRLVQVMLNLLTNAAKFCEAGSGRVTVVLERTAEAWRIDVIDNGSGIELAHQLEIFEKFRQVGGSLARKPQGTGLGLPICREIINHFGGRLWVESAPGNGATFSFTLPAAAAGADAAGPVRYGT
jgi:signal transduction histidine kinase